MTFVQHYDSPLGGILLAADETGVTGLWFDGQKYFGIVAQRFKRTQQISYHSYSQLRSKRYGG